jgi:ATP-dependent Clp protease adaptor protein ClpS
VKPEKSQTMTKEIYKEKKKVAEKATAENEHLLVLVNDDVHTFDYVIDALIAICEHTEEQATQCAMITHYKGQCDIKKGNFKTLRPMRRALIDKELRARIN